MLSTVGSFIAYPIAGELLHKSIKKAGSWALANSGKLYSAAKAAGRATYSTLRSNASIRNYQNFRTAVGRRYATEFRRINKKTSANFERFATHIRKGYDKRIDLIARKVGGRTNFGRKLVRDAIKGEVKFLPMTYVMYKREQMQGNIPANEGFLKYYATTGLPMSLGFSIGADIGKRAFKTMGRYALGGKSSLFGLESIGKLGAESLHNLNKTTKGLFAVYDNAMSKFVAANHAFKTFGSTTAAIKAIAKTTHATSIRKSRRSGLAILRRNVRDAELQDKDDLIQSYAEMQGDVRSDMKTYGRKKTNLIYDSIVTGEGELKRDGFAGKFAKVHKSLRNRIGANAIGDDVGYVTRKAVTKAGATRVASESGDIVTSSTMREVTTDRAHIDFLGGRYDLGVFHVDAVRDSMDKVATQFLRIANRPWLRFLDAGSHFLMSKKTKLLTQGIQQGQGVVGLGSRSLMSLYTMSRANDKELMDSFQSGDYETSAKRAVRLMTGQTDEVASGYLDSKVRRAVEFVKGTGKKDITEEEIKRQVFKDISFGVIKGGEWQLGAGDTLDVLGKYARVHTKIAGPGGEQRVTFNLQLGNGAPIEGAKLLRADTRAGQIAGGILGSKATIQGEFAAIEKGIENNTNVSFQSYYKDGSGRGLSGFLAKVGDFLEWNGGSERSLVGTSKSAFTKWNDSKYVGSVATSVARGAMKRADIEEMLKDPNSSKKGEVLRAMGGYAEDILGGVFNSLRATAFANQDIDENFKMSGMIARVKSVISKTGKFKHSRTFDDFDVERAVINQTDSMIEAQNKLNYTLKFMRDNAGFAKELGFEETPVLKLKQHFDNSKTGNIASAMADSLSKNGDRVDQYNKHLFDFVLGVGGDNREIGDLLSGIAAGGSKRVSNGVLRYGETNANGIAAALSMRKVGNTLVENKGSLTAQDINIAVEAIENLSGTWVGSGRNSILEAMTPFGGKKRVKEAMGSENKFVIVSENEVPGVRISKGDLKSSLPFSGIDGNSEVRMTNIKSSELQTLAAVGTMNSALSMIGLGFDLQNTFTVSDIITKTLFKRVLPIAGLFAAHDVATSIIQKTPVLQDTSLAGGVTGMLWDAYAGARVLSQTITDITGISAVARKAEELVPGSIDSPLSGLVRGILPIAMGLKLGSMSRLGPTRGGAIGTAIGMVLGGGPLGLFDDSWNIAKGREEVIKELSGEKEVAVSKGRFWEMSSGSFWGTKTTYFRPSMYALQKAQYQRADNYIGSDISDQLTSYVDPSVYAKKHMFTRPYEMVGGFGSNIPIVGTALNAMVGGPQYMHQDFLQEMSQSSILTGGTIPGLNPIDGAMGGSRISTGRGSFYGGDLVGGMSASSLPVINPTDLGAAIDTTASNMLDVAGLRGFLLGNVIDATAGGGESGFGGGYRLESANDIASFSKSYWEKELGGLAGASEGIRRIFSSPSPGDTERINRIANTMPIWMPGKDSFTDFLTGDPFCLSYDTPVLQKDGYTKAGEVKVGSLIYTHKGNWLPVKRKIKRSILENEKVYSLEVSGINKIPLEFSEEHPLLIKKVNSCSIRHGNCRIPVRNYDGFCDKNIKGRNRGCHNSWNKNEVKFVEVKDVEIGDYLVYPIPEEKNIISISTSYLFRPAPRSPEKEVIFDLLINKNIMWAFGLYMSEGSTGKKSGKPMQLVYSMSAHETHILKKVLDILSSVFGCSGRISVEDNSSQLVVCSTRVAQLFDSLIPGNLYEKRIPDFVYSCSNEQKVAFIFGMLLGDGNVLNGKRSLSLSSANKNLALDFRRLCFTAGIACSFNYRTRFDKRTGKSSIEYINTINIFNIADYELTFLDFKAKQLNLNIKKASTLECFSDGKYVYQKVTGKKVLTNIKEVYGFEVDNDDSFCSFDFATHNTKAQYGEVRLPGDAYERTHNVYYTYPIDSSMMGKSFEEQVSFYSGDVSYLSNMRRRWHVVERTRKELIGELKKTMPIIKEKDVAYDVNNDVHAYVDAVMEDQQKVKTAIAVAPMLDNRIDPGGVAQLNAYLVNNTREIRQGLLIGLDKDGNITKQMIYADSKKYLNEVKMSQSAARKGASITRDLQEEGYSVQRWPAYSHLNRLQILVNISPFSKETQLEMKIVQKQIEANQLGNKEMETYRNIMDQFLKRLNSMKNQEYKFLPLVMGKTPMGTQAIKLRQEAEKYSTIEQYIGAAGEYVTHLRNPLTNKFIGKKSAYEQYREDIALGKNFKKWQNPVEDFIGTNLSLMAAEEDPVQAALSGATGGFIFGGPVGAGIGAGISGLASFFGLTNNSRASRLEQIDEVQSLADALKYKESGELDEEYEARDRRFTLRRKSTAYYSYNEGVMAGEAAGFNDVTGSLSSGEKGYVKRMMQNMYKEDMEDIAPLLPKATRGLFLSYAQGQTPDTSYYQDTMTSARRVIEGGPLRFRSDDMIYKTMVSRGMDAHSLGLGWTQQVNRVKYLENTMGMKVPGLDQDDSYPGVIPSFGAIRL